MSCIIKYKGQSIPEEQFLQYLNKQIAINNLFNENESFANAVYEVLGVKPANISFNIEPFGKSIDNIDVIKDNEKIGYVQISKNNNTKTLTVTGIELKEKGFGKNVYLKLQQQYPDFTIKSDSKNLSESAIKMWDSLVNKQLATKEADKQYTLDTQQAQQLYSQYLDTIFPDSKVKDIVYHGTGEKFDIFDFKLVGKTTKGFANAAFFTNDKNWAFSRFALADTHQVWGKEGVVLSALINIKNPKIFDTVFDFNKSIEEGIYTNLNEELNEKLRDIFPPVKSGKIYFVVNLNKQLKPEFKFVDENQREEKYSELTGKYTVPKNITEQEYLNTLSKEEKNNFLIKKQKLNDIISSYSTDIDKAIKGLTTKTAALSGKEDSVIQTHPNTDTKEYAVFEPEQIHVLGSKTDIQGFKDFVQGKQFQKLTERVETGRLIRDINQGKFKNKNKEFEKIYREILSLPEEDIIESIKKCLI